jgi:hypothetical protein
VFDHLAGDALEILSRLESQLPMLSDEDQGFVIGCRHHISAGAPLTVQNKIQLREIARTLSSTGHSSLGGALSMGTVFANLASAIRTLNPQERQFANQMAYKYQNKQPFTQPELASLLGLYTAKGF